MQKTITLLLVSIIAIYAENINLRGTITNAKGEPVSNVSVELLSTDNGTTSNDEGYFKVDENIPITSNYQISGLNKFQFIDNRLIINIDKSSDVSVKIVKLNGQMINLFSGTIEAGYQVIATDCIKNLAKGIYILLVEIDGYLYKRKIITENSYSNISSTNTFKSNSRVQRATNNRYTIVDTLKFSKNGYKTKHVPICKYDYDLQEVRLRYPDILSDSSDFINNDKRTFNVEWTDVEWFGDGESDSITSVNFLDTNYLNPIKVELICKERENDSTDWKTAALGGVFLGVQEYEGDDYWEMEALELYDNMGFMVVEYKVDNSDDTIAFSLTTSDTSYTFFVGYEHELGYYSSFRAVLTNGANNPGKFVRDTLTFRDFSLIYGNENTLLMNELGYNKNHDGNVYLHENKQVLKDLVAYSFQTEANIEGNDTIVLTVKDVEFWGNYRSETVDGMPLLKRGGFIGIHDENSQVNIDIKDSSIHLEMIRGASDGQADKWAYAAALGVFNPEGTFENLSTIHIKYIVPRLTDTLSIGIERGERFGADIQEDWAYGSFRCPIWYDTAYEDVNAGDTMNMSIGMDMFIMNWGDNDSARYQFEDTIDQAFLREANAISFFCETDNGPLGAAEHGDTLILEILEISLTGKNGFDMQITPLK